MVSVSFKSFGMNTPAISYRIDREMSEHLTPALCRAARGPLNWASVRVASRAGMSESVVRAFESERHMPGSNKVASIRRTLKAEGVVFSPNGVRLRGARAATQPSLADGEAGIIANSEM